MNVKRHTSWAKSSSDSRDNIHTKNKRANIKKSNNKKKHKKVTKGDSIYKAHVYINVPVLLCTFILDTK